MKFIDITPDHLAGMLEGALAPAKDIDVDAIAHQMLDTNAKDVAHQFGMETILPLEASEIARLNARIVELEDVIGKILELATQGQKRCMQPAAAAHHFAEIVRECEAVGYRVSP